MLFRVQNKKIIFMKYSRELTNGFFIFLGISIYFLIIEFLRYSDVFLLRIFNVVFVIAGVHLTLYQNFKDNIKGYFTNLKSAILTSLFGAVFSIASLLAYINYNGGEVFLKTLSNGFIFGGGELSIYQYAIGLFFESVAASLMVSFSLMQYWKGRSADTKSN
jgi:hypothetical protein